MRVCGSTVDVFASSCCLTMFVAWCVLWPMDACWTRGRSGQMSAPPWRAGTVIAGVNCLEVLQESQGQVEDGPIVNISKLSISAGGMFLQDIVEKGYSAG